MENNQDFYTVMEFANKLRIHPNTVRKAIKQGKVQAFRVGIGKRSDFRIPITEVNRMMEMDMMKVIEVMIDEKLKDKKVID